MSEKKAGEISGAAIRYANRVTQNIMLAIMECDEHAGQDGLCNCARTIHHYIAKLKQDEIVARKKLKCYQQPN